MDANINTSRVKTKQAMKALYTKYIETDDSNPTLTDLH